jgi:thiosulfate dehydrogenase (quinone) large subunit
VGFLSHTKTFHDVFVIFTTPTMAPITTFLVEYGHLLIGLSLLTGLMVRVSASFGVLLMCIYWFAHMDWPFIENTNNFIVDYQGHRHPFRLIHVNGERSTETIDPGQCCPVARL